MSVSEVEIPSWMVVPVFEAADSFAKKHRLGDQDAAVLDAAVKHAYERFVRPKADGSETSAATRLKTLSGDSAREKQVFHDVVQELTGDLRKGASWLNTVTGASHSWASDRP